MVNLLGHMFGIVLIMSHVFTLCWAKSAVTPAPSPEPSAGQSIGICGGAEPGISFLVLDRVGLAGSLVGISVGALTSWAVWHLGRAVYGALALISFGAVRVLSGHDAG